MPRIDQSIPKSDQRRMSQTRAISKNLSKEFSMENIRDLDVLESIAWLEGANRPLGEIHEASTKAIKAGHTWKEVANARGMGHDHAAARSAASAHNTWHKRNRKLRDI